MLHESPRYDTRTMFVSVDSYEKQVPTGRLFYPARGEHRSFSSLAQLLLQINACMDVENTPQAFHAVRTFFPLAECVTKIEEDITLTTGKEETFTVQVLYRRNASWQGKLTWLEKGQTELFGSVLEFIHLLSSALTDGDLVLRFAAGDDRNLGIAE